MAANKLRPHHPEEYAKLLEWASGAGSVLEIGSRYGYTLTDIAEGMNMLPGRIVSVDFPGAGAWGEPDSEPVLRLNMEMLKAKGYDTHLFLTDSRNRATVEAVRALGPFDFVFIDGDHRYWGARHDWETYGPMSKVVVFHDIREPQAGENQALEVWRLWSEVKELRADAQEFLAAGSKMGIGRVG